MLDRMIGVARAKVMRYLAAFGAFGIASAANAQTVEYEFHFNDPPTSDCTEVDEFCFYYDPTFEVSGFEVTHTADEGDAVQWIGVSESQGYVQDSTAGGFSAVIGFEEEVDSFGICLTVTDDGADSAILTPILSGGGSGPWVSIDDEDYPFCVGNDSGPFIGLEVSAPPGETLIWLGL